MHQHRARRLIAGLAVAATAVLGSAMPAEAAPEPRAGLWLLEAYNVGVDDEITVEPRLSASGPMTVTGATITYELTGDLAGVSLVNPAGGGCTSASPTRLTCTASSPLVLGTVSRYDVLHAGIRTTAAAVMGTTGTLRTTFSADGVDDEIDTAAVRVIDRIDMAVPEPKLTVDVEPGGTFTSRLRLANVGRNVIKGAGILFGAPHAIASTASFSNCIYNGDHLSACGFDQDLQPGVTYEMKVPFRLRADTYAPDTLVADGLWTDRADYRLWADELLSGRTHQHGTGGPLALEPVASLRAAEQYDRTAEDNWQYITVKVLGEQGADVAAVGAEVSGAAGAVVDAEIGVRNLGPAALDLAGPYTRSSVAVVTIPPGAEVVTVPYGCKPAGEMRYLCATFEVLSPGETITWKFGLRIMKVVPNATGRVEANPPCNGDKQCGSFTEDLNPANDTAALVLNPTGAQPGDGGVPGGGGTGGVPGGGGTGGGTDGGTGGGLPITGPQGATIAVAGALLVTAGVVGVLTARRRRARFEA